jgi:hypothetical protein
VGSSEPLGKHFPDYIDTQDSGAIPVDDDYVHPPSPTTDASDAASGSGVPSKIFADPSRKRSVLGEEDIDNMSIIT